MALITLQQMYDTWKKVSDWVGGSSDAPQVKLANNMEYYGATVADRPAANEVPVGAVFMAVDTQEVWQSNGSTWVVI